jgi:hypothetical protein
MLAQLDLRTAAIWRAGAMRAGGAGCFAGWFAVAGFGASLPAPNIEANADPVGLAGLKRLFMGFQ